MEGAVEGAVERGCGTGGGTGGSKGRWKGEFESLDLARLAVTVDLSAHRERFLEVPANVREGRVEMRCG